jgi:hypothetical protein
LSQLLLAAKEILDWLDDQNVDGCLIGGLAVQRWGEPRFTHDVDLTVLAEFGSEAQIVDILFQKLASRIDGAREFALRHRVALLRASNGVDIDIALGATSFEVESFRRASIFEFAPGLILRTCSAEDLLVHKVVAGRPQDIADIRGIINRQSDKLNLNLIRKWLKIFSEAKEDANLARPFEVALKDAQAVAKRSKKS